MQQSQLSPEYAQEYAFDAAARAELIEKPETNLAAFKHGGTISKDVWGQYFSEEVQVLLKDTLEESDDQGIVITGGTVYRMIGGGNPGSDIDIMAERDLLKKIRDRTTVNFEGTAISVTTTSGDDLDLLDSAYFANLGVAGIKRYLPLEQQISLLKKFEQGEILERDLFQLFPWETMEIKFGLGDGGELEAKFHDPNNYIEQAKLVEGKIVFPGFHENALYGEFLHQFDQAITHQHELSYPEPRVAIWAMTSGIRLATAACVLDKEVITSVLGDERLNVFNENETSTLSPDRNQHYFDMMARVIKHLGENKPLIQGEGDTTQEVNDIMKQQTQRNFAKAALNDPIRAYEYFFQVFEAGTMIAPQVQRNFDEFHENFAGISNNILHLIEHAEERGAYEEQHLVPELIKDRGVQSLLRFKQLCEEKYGKEKTTAKHPESMSEIFALMYLANELTPDEVEKFDTDWWKLNGTVKPSNPRYTNVEFDTSVDAEHVKKIMIAQLEKSK